MAPTSTTESASRCWQIKGAPILVFSYIFPESDNILLLLKIFFSLLMAKTVAQDSTQLQHLPPLFVMVTASVCGTLL